MIFLIFCIGHLFCCISEQSHDAPHDPFRDMLEKIIPMDINNINIVITVSTKKNFIIDSLVISLKVTNYNQLSYSNL